MRKVIVIVIVFSERKVIVIEIVISLAMRKVIVIVIVIETSTYKVQNPPPISEISKVFQ